MVFLISASALAITAYIALLGYYTRHWEKTHAAEAEQVADDVPYCSVVIAARNEAGTIAQCLSAVIAQTYPPERFEIIVVNDHSSDNTVGISRQFPGVVVSDAIGAGKKQALAEGITLAKGNIIAISDADCIVPPDWLRFLASALKGSTVMVTGPVLVDRPVNAFERFQALDLAGLSLVTAAGIHSGLHHLANGANMAFHKHVYLAAGGFSGHQEFASGDDVFLIQDIVSRIPGSVRFLKHRDVAVTTPPVRSVRSFIHQRSRWASKNTALPEKSVFLIWMFIGIAFTLTGVAFVSSVFHSLPAFALMLLILSVLAIAEYVFLQRAVRFYAKERELRHYILSFVLHFIYIAGMTLLQCVPKRIQWKGRRIR